jgi:hypothetical protein
MALDLVDSLPKELGPVLDKIAGRAVVVTASASNNIARDNAVQVCGPVAGTIQYVYVCTIPSLLLPPLAKWINSAYEEPYRFNLSLNYNTGESDTCWRLVGRAGAAEVSTSGRSSPKTSQELSQMASEASQMVSPSIQLSSLTHVYSYPAGPAVPSRTGTYSATALA